MNSISYLRVTQFFLLGLIAIILPMAPVNLTPTIVPMPDLFFCFIMAWHLRDPKSSPLALIIGLTLLMDIFNFRPIGLWPLLMIIISNLIHINRRLFFYSNIIKELLFFSMVFFSAMMCEFIFLFIMFLPTKSFSMYAQEVIITSLTYPFIILFLHFFCRLKYNTSRLFFSEKL